MFIHFNNCIYNTDQIKSVDCKNYVEWGFIRVHLETRVEVVKGPEAFVVIQTLCPAILEGKEAEYVKNAWMIHNLVGHPLMQLLSWVGLPALGIKVHDATIPDPKIKDPR